MKKTMLLSVKTDKKSISGLANKLKSEYDKNKVLTELERAMVLKEYAKTLFLEITCEDVDEATYCEQVRIIADSFVFNYVEYDKAWGFYADGYPNTPNQKYTYAPSRANYGLPKTLKKWDKKKYDAAIRYLQQYEKNLQQGERDKQDQITKRASVEKQVCEALKTENVDRDDDETVVWNDIVTVTICGSGQMSIKITDCKIKNKIAFLKSITN